MKKRVATAAAIFLSACGGGGGESAPSYALKSSELRDIQPGDLLVYQAKRDGSRDDGEFAIDDEGSLSTSFGGGGTLAYGENPKPGYTYISQSDYYETADGTIADSSILASDPDGKRYALSQETSAIDTTCYLQESDFDAYGPPPLLPATISIGQEFGYQNYPFSCDDGATLTVNYLANVVAVETVSTPAGKFEAYKIAFQSTKDYDGVLLVQVSDAGTMWVYPPVGVVKFKITSTFSNVGGYYTYNAEQSLESANFAFE